MQQQQQQKYETFKVYQTEFERKTRELLTTEKRNWNAPHKNIMQAFCQQKPIEKNLFYVCEIQWNKRKKAQRKDIVNLHADDLQIDFTGKRRRSERENVFCIQLLGPLILFNVERDACIRLVGCTRKYLCSFSRQTAH